MFASGKQMSIKGQKVRRVSNGPTAKPANGVGFLKE
jgi:hypothetical protein